MSIRLGTVLTFAEDVTKEEAAEILTDLQVRGKVEHRVHHFDMDLGRYRNSTPSDEIEEFESDHGGPVWYLP